VTNEPAGTLTHRSSTLVRLCAAIFACNLAALAQQVPSMASPLTADDEGVFLISVAGRSVGSESFKIHFSAGKVVARGEIRLHVAQNGKAMNVQSYPTLTLDAQLHPLSYTWSQQGPQSSRLEIDFRSNPAKVRYKTVNGSVDDRSFQLAPDVMVLDDNVIHQFQLIAARFQAMGGGKQTMPVFVPQEALPSVLTIEEAGKGDASPGTETSHRRHLVITTDVTHIDLWVDEQRRLERVLVPAAQLEAVRKN